MKRLITTVMLTVLACTLSSCLEVEKGGCSEPRTRVQGSGHVVTEERSLDGISGVSLATMGTLYIKLGDEEKLVIEAEDNLIDYFRVRVQGGVLTIGTRRNTNLDCQKPVKYHLTVRDLTSISISSSGDIIAPDIEAERFRVNVSSSGDLEMRDLKVNFLRVVISSSGSAQIADLRAGAADVTISSSGSLHIGGGEVEEQDITVSSSGSYRADALESARARVRLSSSGNAYVHVTEDLDAVLSSSGSVYYAGNPSIRKVASSSGRVRPIGM